MSARWVNKCPNLSRLMDDVLAYRNRALATGEPVPRAITLRAAEYDAITAEWPPMARPGAVVQIWGIDIRRDKGPGA